MARYIGRSIPRVEDERFLIGQGRYTDDIVLDGQLYCVFVRSPHAHARIGDVDTGEARNAEGVVAVLTGGDYRADGHGGIEHGPNPADGVDITRRAFVASPGGRILDLPHWPLALDRVRYVGEALAVVIAESAAQARDAAELVAVDYEVLASVAAPIAASEEGAPQLWEEAPRNLCFSVDFGDADATRGAMARAAQVIRHEFVNNRIANCQMEPRAALGDYDAATDVHILISGSQGVFFQQTMLAAALKVPMERVRVICPDVGGGFGPRTHLYPEQLVVVWAARRLRRPVKWTSDRSEAFLSDYQGRDSAARAALALDSAGRILAYEVEWFGNVGAHTVTYTPMSNARRVLTSVYHVPAMHFQVRGVLTNTVPTAPYRGAGRPEAMHLIERLLDMAARRTGIDRVEIRRRNIVRREMLPYRSAMGLEFDSGDFAGYMESALALAQWEGFAARREDARRRHRLAGIGVANHLETPVGFPIERVIVCVTEKGGVEVTVGTQSTGQGHETTFAQVVADQLGVPMQAVRIRYGDTAFVGLGGGTHSDRSMRIAGTLMVKGCAEVIERGRQRAAGLLEVAAEDLVFEDGSYRVAGTDRVLGILELAQALGPQEAREVLASKQDFKGRIPAYPAGSAVCELEVDAQTGQVQITRYTIVHDVGQAINPMIVDGQTHGGIVQGVGQALHEAVRIDEQGQVLTGSFMDYGICRADDVPSFALGHAEDPTAGNPLRVKGGGEGGIVGATAAVINALCDALAESGVEDMPMPATPVAIWSAIHRPGSGC